MVIDQTAKFVGELETVERVDVLTFHQMGQYKWKGLALNRRREK